MIVITARRYVSARARALTADEAETRRIAYALKMEAGADQSFETAAREMARLIDAPCVLIPVPDSKGGTSVNRRLCSAIARLKGRKCRMCDCLHRKMPIQSQCLRHRQHIPPATPEEHGIYRVGRLLDVSIPVYCVDNVITSGSTLEACRLVIHTARGLVFADASTRWSV